MTIKIQKGLDVPIEGDPAQEIEVSPIPKKIALDLTEFYHLRLRPNCKEGEDVSAGQVLAHDNHLKKRVFLSPASGKVIKIQRGEKRKIEQIIIEVKESEKEQIFSPVSLKESKEYLIEKLLEYGLFAHIWQRPLKRPAHPEVLPQLIFIQGLESAPFVPDPKYEIKGREEEFQYGISVLAKIAPVHLVYRDEAFASFKDVNQHRASGPHPIANPSVHIEAVSPITNENQVIWTLKVQGVLSIGSAFKKGKPHLFKTIALAGEGVKKEFRKNYYVRNGLSIDELTNGKLVDSDIRIISGDLLTGKVSRGFLGFFHNSITVINEVNKPEILPFLRMRKNEYTFSRGYLSAFSNKKAFSFSTQLKGSLRPIVMGDIYNKVMPLHVPVIPLLKAILANDFEMAIKLGLLEIDAEDFALCEFICPSKTPFTKIISRGIDEYIRLTFLG